MAEDTTTIPTATTPSPPAVPVVVTPIPASQSRTLRTIKWAAIGTGAMTVLSFLITAFGDPILAPFIEKYIPAPTRLVIVTLVGIYLRGTWRQRMDTSQPIIGSSGEQKAKENA